MNSRDKLGKEITQLENIKPYLDVLFIGVLLFGMVMLNCFLNDNNRIVGSLIYLGVYLIISCIAYIIFNIKLDRSNYQYKILTLKLYLESEKNIPTELRREIEKELNSKKPKLNYSLIALSDAYSEKLYDNSDEAKAYREMQAEYDRKYKELHKEVMRLTNNTCSQEEPNNTKFE